MMLARIGKIAAGVSIAATLGFLAMNVGTTKAHAQQQNDSDEQLAAIGLRIAPVTLNLAGKDLKLVGLGSFIVNAQADCNGCHNSSPTGSEYGSSHNPYLLSPANVPPWKVAAQYYLGGGQNFGPAGAGVSSGPYAAGTGNGPLIISRNLTPDHTGLPEGGHTLDQFLTIMRTGHDFDTLHLNCSTGVTTNCYNPPTDGAVLQVMPWPSFSNMTDNQLTAIWTYLSAIPCIANTGSPFPNLINKCS
jgi:hypothetical protein